MPNRRDEAVPGRGHGGASGGALPDGGVPSALRSLSWGLPSTFLGLDEDASKLSSAGAVILPVPYESTTSYGGGAQAGPGAIIDASKYIELYDQELDCEPSDLGIHTLPPLELTRAGAESAMAELGSAYGTVLDSIAGRFPIMLGGEHSVSSPPIRCHADRIPGRLSVLQFDAHADLRASFDGTEYSHACAMARILDCADVVGVGIRGISREEVEVARAASSVDLIFADEMWENDQWIDRALEALGEDVYITFDVDYLDPSLMPSTGTPEPGGGDWYRTLRLLRRVFQERNVVGCDVVELAPIPGFHAPDFLVAKLVYKLIGYHREAVRARAE